MCLLFVNLLALFSPSITRGSHPLCFLCNNIQILAGIQPTPDVVEVLDNSDGLCDGGAKLEVLVVASPAFDGMPLLKRHRLVNDCLKQQGLMSQIHALSLKTYTVAQYESKK